MRQRTGRLGFVSAATLLGTMLLGVTLLAAALVPIAAAGAASKPGAPHKPLVAPGKAEVKVIWSAPKSNGSPITGYVVTPFLGKAAQKARRFKSASTAQVITGLTNAKVYTFRVAAKSKVGVGPASPPSNGVTPTSTPTVRAVMNATIGQKILVNARGLTLYLFAPDGSATKSKAGSLLSTWPAVVWAGKPTVGPGLSAAKIAVHPQANRASQVSYNKHLLYTFVSDHKPGDVTGQGVESFYVVSASGAEILY
jgi:predicted lipoprotein with Yx(FWY)xxD motif